MSKAHKEGKPPKVLPWVKSLLIVGLSAVLVAVIASVGPGLLDSFGPYAFRAYGGTLFWGVLGAGFGLVGAVWAWGITYMLRELRESAREPSERAWISARGVRPLLVIAWVIVTPLAGIGIAAIPHIKDHPNRSGVAQFASNDIHENRIQNYESLEDEPNRFPWEERSALWVDQYYCHMDAGSHLSSTLVAEPGVQNRSPEEAGYEVFAEGVEYVAEMLGSAELDAALERSNKYRGEFLTEDAREQPVAELIDRFVELRADIVESCGTDLLNEEEWGSLERADVTRLEAMLNNLRSQTIKKGLS